MVSRCFKYLSECHQIEISPQGSHATASTHISAHLSTCSSRIQDGTVSRAVLLNSVRGSGAATLQEEEWFTTSMRWHSAAVPCLGALLLALFAFFAFFAFFLLLIFLPPGTGITGSLKVKANPHRCRIPPRTLPRKRAEGQVRLQGGA